MPDRLIVNASPLILLSAVGGVEWILRLSPAPILVPRAVLNEVAAGAGGEEIARSLAGDPRFVSLEDIPVPALIEAWSLGAGESQVLAVSRQTPGSIALLDDRAARQCAAALDIPVLGTLGTVLIAKRRGWIAAARPIIESLAARKMYLTADLVAAALREVGE